MRSDPNASEVEAALSGDAQALERLLKSIESMVFCLAVRMLGNHADAEDMSQEVLVRIATRLSSFNGESLFSTWAYRLAANAIIDHIRANETRRQFEQIGLELERGLERSNASHDNAFTESAESYAAANEMALLCSQGMLSALDASQRLAYILGEVFDFSSEEAAVIADVTPAAFRQQLSRARDRLRTFMSQHCSLVGDEAACRCESQVNALDQPRVIHLHQMPLSRGLSHQTLPPASAREGLRTLDELQRVSRVFRAHPEYLADADLTASLRARISSSVFGRA
jgi:RNA polymerase sigma factor (sigma-70 family)